MSGFCSECKVVPALKGGLCRECFMRWWVINGDGE